MRRSFALLVCIMLLCSCRYDDTPTEIFVEDFSLKVQYGGLQNFSNRVKADFVNETEQFSYCFESDETGNIAVSGLMPGIYSLSIRGELTAAECHSLGYDYKRASLSGYASNLRLRLGEKPEIGDLNLFVVPDTPVIFKEIYFAGSHTPTEGNYRNDSFWSIVNNSDEPYDIGKLYIGMCENYGGHNESGPLWPGETLGNYTNVYVQSLWKICPSRMLSPGEVVVIATMAAPHNKQENYNLASPVDLSKADYEAYIPDPENKYPDLPAPNMTLVFWPDYAYLWRSGVFGQACVLIEAEIEEVEDFETVTLPETFQDPFESEEYWLCKKIPNSFVVDAVDIVANSTATFAKRLSPELDAGFAYIGEIYSGKSIIRKDYLDGDRTRWRDTNNSTEDFVVNPLPLSK